MPSVEITNFAGGFYQAICSNVAADTAVNIYTETRDVPGSAKQVWMNLRPGLKSYIDFSPSTGCRGSFSQDGRTWTVIGDTLYELNVSAAGKTALGTIANDGLRVSFASNGRGGEQLGIFGGGELKVLDLQTNVLSAAIDLPFDNPVMLAFIDGYTLCLEANSPKVWFSALENMESWDALDFFARSNTSDNLVGIIVSVDRVFCIGTKTTTQFYDSGGADVPFLPYSGTTVQVGGLTSQLIGIYSDAIYFAGQSANGQRSVYRIAGGVPQPISTPPVDLWLNAGNVNTAEMDICQIDGHTFVIITAPDITAPQYRSICTFAYDVKENTWAQWAGWDAVNGLFLRWRGRGITAAEGFVLCGDATGSVMYEMTLTHYMDADEDIHVERTIPYLSNENQWLFLDQIEMGVQSGVAGSPDATIEACPSPLILDLDPDSADVGDPITITGMGFGDTQGSSFVTLGELEMDVETWSDTEIVADVPVGADSGAAVVVTLCGSSNPVVLTIAGCVIPTLLLLNPDTGVEGDPITITGTAFGASQGSSTVTFGGLEAAIVSWSDTSIVATVPTGATTGSVLVTTDCGISNTLPFTVPEAMRQYILNAQTSGIGADERVMALMGASVANFPSGIALAQLEQPWSTAGNFSNFRIVLDTAPGVGTSLTFAVVVNGTDSAMSITISDTDVAGEYLTDLAVADGDILYIRQTVSGVPVSSPFTWALEFSPTVEQTACYSSNRRAVDDVLTLYNGLFAGGAPWVGVADIADVTDIAALAGTVTKLRATLNNVPLGTYDLYIYKNGVKQDGGGGTVDTHLPITLMDTSASVSFSLPVAAGDTFYLGCIPGTGGNQPFIRNIGFSCEFVADAPGVSMFCGRTGASGLSNTTTEYMPPTLRIAPDPSESDTGQFVRCGVTPFTVTAMYVVLPDGSPGSGNDYAFVTRRNGATPGGVVSVQIADAATTGNGSSSGVIYATDDKIGIQIVPTSSPTGRVMALSCVVQV